MAGRRNLYESNVAPFFYQIDKMLNDGATEAQVAKSLGIAYPTWNKYKVTHDDFRELCNKPRIKLIEDLRSALIKRALGYEYEEKKVFKRKPKDGEPETTYIEIYTKQMPPDVAALNLALKNYDKNNWANDPQSLELKKQELELRREMNESKDW